MGSLGYCTDNYLDFPIGSTSVSCALVSGVAALMLSANSSLSSNDVTDILHNTARQVGNYSQNEIGYGLVDAYSATVMAGTKIIGSDYLCSTTDYYVSCLPPGATVSWSISGTGASAYSLYSNTPTTNHCRLIRNNSLSSTYFFLSITAQIIWHGSVFKTITKQLTGNSGAIFRYDQPSCSSFYNHSYTFPEIENMPISPNETKFVPVGCLFVLKSGYFVGKTITTVGTPWWFDKHFKGELQLVLAPPSASDSFTIIIGARACDEEVQFTFYPLPESGMIYAYSVDMTLEGEQHYKLAIAENEEYSSKSPQNDRREVVSGEATTACLKTSTGTPAWSVNAINVKTGVKAFQTDLSQPTFIMDTSHWEPGVYVIRAFTGGDVIFAKKIIVK